jgi:hypothetical protein
VTWQAASECSGLDHVCEVLLRVQGAVCNSQEPCCIFLLSVGPLYKCVPTAGWTLPVKKKDRDLDS